MPTALNATICVNGQNYQSEESMPENVRQAFERVVSSALKTKHSFFVGSSARFVPRLKSRIVCESGEFGDAGEMPATERRRYEEALAAMLPECIVERVARSEIRLQQRNKLFVVGGSLIATIGYLAYHDCLSFRFLIHFLRFLCGFVGI